jgi:hypothetical protein
LHFILSHFASSRSGFSDFTPNWLAAEHYS